MTENQPARSNLLNQTPANETEIDRSLVKITILAIVTIILAFLFGYFTKSFFIVGSREYLLAAFSAALGFLSFFLLNVFFIKSLTRAILIIFLESGAALAGFYDQFSLNLAIGAAVLAVFLFWSAYSGQTEMKNLLKIKFWRIGKIVIPKAITALALFTSVAFYYTNPDFFISRSSFEKIIAPSAPLVQKILPEFDLSLPVGELINKLAQGQVEGNPEAKVLPENVKQQLISRTSGDVEKKIADFLGAPLDAKQKVSDSLYGAAVQKIAALSEQGRKLVSVGVAALLFLSIVGFIWPIRWLTTLLALIFYEIFLALGFAVITLEGKSKEIIILK